MNKINGVRQSDAFPILGLVLRRLLTLACLRAICQLAKSPNCLLKRPLREILRLCHEEKGPAEPSLPAILPCFLIQVKLSYTLQISKSTTTGYHWVSPVSHEAKKKKITLLSLDQIFDSQNHKA